MKIEGSTEEEFLNNIVERKEDFILLDSIIREVLGDETRRYETKDRMSGISYGLTKDGLWPQIGLIPQKNYIGLYIMMGKDGKPFTEYYNKTNLGSVSTGKSCIRIKRMSKVNIDVVKEMLLEMKPLLNQLK